MTINDQQAALTPQRLRGRPRPEDVAVIENKLLGVALKEFFENGYGGTSMTRIVKAAGVSKTTLYSRFASKKELFRAIIHHQIDQISPSAALRSDGGPLSLEDGLRSFANYMLELNLQGDMLGVNRLIYSESHRFPELGAAAAERTALGIRRISRFIQDCAIADAMPCKDPDAAAEVFILMLRGWYVDILLTNQEVSVAQRELWVGRALRILLLNRKDW